MTAFEFAATAIIATCAMIGGAVLNAAITSPERCDPVLKYLYRWMGPFVSTALGLIMLVAGRRYMNDTLSGFFSDPLVWVATAELALMWLLMLARSFVELARKGHNNQGNVTTDEDRDT